MDRLDELLNGVEPQWHLREIERVLCEEDLGYGLFPKCRDVQKVGDLKRIGAEALKIRFRELDPAIWDWLFERLGEIE